MERAGAIGPSQHTCRPMGGSMLCLLSSCDTARPSSCPEPRRSILNPGGKAALADDDDFSWRQFTAAFRDRVLLLIDGLARGFGLRLGFVACGGLGLVAPMIL